MQILCVSIHEKFLGDKLTDGQRFCYFDNSGHRIDIFEKRNLHFHNAMATGLTYSPCPLTKLSEL